MVTEFVLGPDGAGRWVMSDRATGLPIRSFATHGQGLAFARVYAGRKGPSRLIVQGPDGAETASLDYAAAWRG